MRIKLDRTLCDGFGMCAEHVPETFVLDEWGYVSLAPGGDMVASEDEDAMRRAIEDCPVTAITVWAAGEGPSSRSGPSAT